MSYPLYLNAWIPLFIVNAVFKRAGLVNPFAHHVLVLGLNLVMAALLYWHIDRRILSSRRRLYTPGRARIVTAVGYGTLSIGLSLGWLLYRG